MPLYSNTDPDHDDEIIEDSNPTDNPEFANMLIKRRSILKGGAGLMTASFFGSLPLMGCVTGAGAKIATNGAGKLPKRPTALKFTAVPHYTGGDMIVADGYRAELILPMGTPIVSGLGEWTDDRMVVGESFKYRMGDNHDGMWFFGLKNGSYAPDVSERGLLAMNHEYTNSNLNPIENYSDQDDTAPKIFQKRRLANDVRREIHAHGVSVVEVKRTPTGYELIKDSPFNKRYTSGTPAQLSGVAKGSEFVKTRLDPQGLSSVGINNQCGAGLSPWGTYLTTEENFLNVFARGADKDIIGDKNDKRLARYGLKEDTIGDPAYSWHTPKDGQAGEFDHWDITAKAGKTATDDYRYTFNTFGYITEIDPFNPKERAVKRTSLGRFAHENCAFAPPNEGEPLVFYMGDDARGEYIYKFVSDAKWTNADVGGGLAVGDKYLDKGTLYVAVFHDDGTGQWRELSKKNPMLADFESNAEIAVFARMAGDKVGATKMDRPEWVSVSPLTREIYVTLTNNSKRKEEDVNGANPRSYDGKGNQHGHIIRFAETAGGVGGTFVWDIYLFASPHDKHEQNLSGLTAENDLSSPDGLFFDPRGVLWIQTDDGAYTKTTNCMLLASLPNHIGDGASLTTSTGKTTHMGAKATPDTLKRFFVGPKGCEVTGITMTPDCKALFINIQHPEGTFGAVAGGKTPRSGTVVITKKDGGVILAESLEG
ncbi:Predicted phosphatase [Moraxella lacunata]|uniref:Predicted phosphatase n=1 Tax=Moraxella lacunata TaxID=477 RepID=A0A378T7L8_MORLA|nr:PhoX family phosphatase [Moraxella lacunata]STZ56414.1 Predicted phosphatase [Moraxella lacunata]